MSRGKKERIKLKRSQGKTLFGKMLAALPPNTTLRSFKNAVGQTVFQVIEKCRVPITTETGVKEVLLTKRAGPLHNDPSAAIYKFLSNGDTLHESMVKYASQAVQDSVGS
jgi:hypothetical protein